MRAIGRWAAFLLVTLGLAATAGGDEPLVLVAAGRPVATVVCDRPPADARRGPTEAGDAMAAEVLVAWVEKMTGARLPVAAEAPAEGPAIFLGAAARRAGLELGGIESPSHEGLRIACDGRRVLLAGQNGQATVKAVCRLLEQWGCRYLIDHPLGEVAPRTDRLTLGRLDLLEKPGFVHRRIWGSRWSGNTLWKIWNGAGGQEFDTGHAWGQYVDRKLFAQNPEFFQQRDGRREPSDWYCTSNPELRRVFAEGVSRAIAGGRQNPSISPPDGRGYCQCAACLAQDDPRNIEPSSGTVSVTNRYADFFADVARQVGQKHPEALLNFYCYADYTQAPTSGIRLPENVVAWIAPIRYCRYHAIGQASCPSRAQLAELIEGWSRAAGKLGYRTYNYNLAETLVPISLLSVWKHDVPYLRARGMIGINFETLPNWQIYAPHIYLSIRLAYDPPADADGLLDDFFAHFYGPAAGPMKEYWLAIDRACVALDSHAGSFYAVHRVYTPDLLVACRRELAAAREAAQGDVRAAACVAMAAEGFQNAVDYLAIREDMNRGDFAAVRQTYQSLLARSRKNVAAGEANHYTVTYLERFLGPQVLAGAAAAAPPRQLMCVLPDRWRLAYDEAGMGEAQGYARPDLDDSSWREVATYSEPLDAQGLDDRRTVLWYRTTVELAAPPRDAGLFFTEIDGAAEVYVNGVHVGGSQKKREPFELAARGLWKPGKNLVAVRVDHSTITELFLGGIIRPVLLLAPSVSP